MKKLFLVAILLGLSGCGDNNQSDTSQLDTQTTQLQTTDLAVPTTSNNKLAASSLMMSPAISPLGGWSITNSTVMGASTLIDAVKDSRVSAALVTPNALQVAKVLRGGVAGIALSIAVEQLVGAVDWIMDPENNSIKFTVKPSDPYDPSLQYYYLIEYGSGSTAIQIMGVNPVDACQKYYEYTSGFGYFSDYIGINSSAVAKDPGYCFAIRPGYSDRMQIGQIFPVSNPNYDPNKKPEVKYLPLEAVAEQVISNADTGSLDAQEATNAATQNILNDAVQAEPIVQELENNARDKDPRCKAIIEQMDSLATKLEFRYNDLLQDRYDLYKYYRSTKNAHWSYGSWDGHIIQYNKVQIKLQYVITQAVIEKCTVSTYVRKWSEEKPPTQPLPKG